MRWFLVLFLAFGSAACIECDADETRCNGKKLEMCDADGRGWSEVFNCDQVMDIETGEPLHLVCSENVDGGPLCVEPDAGR